MMFKKLFGGQTERVTDFLAVIIYLLAVSLYDAIVGGSIAAVMQNEGWIQKVNMAYQFGFGITCFVILLNVAARCLRCGVGALILLLGYTEDLLFYLLIPFANGAIEFLTGYTYQTKGGLFPDSISGWLGWVGQMTGTEISLPIDVVFKISGASVILLFFILLKKKYKFNKKTAS